VGLDVPVFDLSRLVYDVGSSFNPLHMDCALQYHVEPAAGDNVLLTVCLERVQLRSFVQLLDSMHGLFRVFDGKARSVLADRNAREVDVFELQERQEVIANHREEVLALFDRFTAEGLTVSESVKATNRALKASGHPWATHALTFSTISSSGRLRKRKRQ
jgi:hypothetical protein